MKLEEAINDIYKIIVSFTNKHTGYLPLFDSIEDMRSECLLRCIKDFNKYDPERGALSTWIFIECRTLCLIKYQKAKRHKFFEQNLESLDEPISNDTNNTKIEFITSSEDLYEKLIKLEKQKEDKNILLLLKPHLCQALKNQINGESISEQAKRLNVTNQAIHQKLGINRRKLRKILESYLKNKSIETIDTGQLVIEIRRILNCAERTAYRHIQIWQHNLKCDKRLKSLFENKTIIQRRRNKNDNSKPSKSSNIK